MPVTKKTDNSLVKKSIFKIIIFPRPKLDNIVIMNKIVASIVSMLLYILFLHSEVII